MAYGFMAYGVNDFYESGPFLPLNFFVFMIKILFFLFKILNNMVVNVIYIKKWLLLTDGITIMDRAGWMGEQKMQSPKAPSKKKAPKF